MSLVVSKWLQQFKKYFFSYKDGFFELPYLANSPEFIVESFGKMPFIKNNAERNQYTTNNLFFSGEGHYHKLEEGLWLIMSRIEIKRNLSFKLIYDSNYPANYHFLTLYVNDGSLAVQLPKLQFNVDFQEHSWALYKAGSTGLNTHFKGQRSIFFSIFFSDHWLQENISSNGLFQNENITSFFSSEHDFLFLQNALEGKKKESQHIIATILNKNELGQVNTLKLKGLTYELLDSFVHALMKSNQIQKRENLSEKDKRKILKAQHILDLAIFDKFPSINYLAKQIGVSETKLKADFKTQNGTSLYQYFVQKQMIYAHELLLKNELSIKEISYALGYSNSNKFSLMYKRHFGQLPSELKKENVGSGD